MELLEFFQPKGDSDKPGKEVCHVMGVQSFARVMEIESMSRHIYESETKEGNAQKQDIGGQRLQWSNPENFERPEEEQDHLKAVAVQIAKNGYDSVRACDGVWIKAWVNEFGVSVKPYGLCYHNEWIF